MNETEFQALPQDLQNMYTHAAVLSSAYNLIAQASFEVKSFAEASNTLQALQTMHANALVLLKAHPDASKIPGISAASKQSEISSANADVSI